MRKDKKEKANEKEMKTNKIWTDKVEDKRKGNIIYTREAMKGVKER